MRTIDKWFSQLFDDNKIAQVPTQFAISAAVYAPQDIVV